MKHKGFKLIIACLLILGMAMVPQFVTAGTNSWTLGSGMYGGNISSLASDGSTLYAGTYYGVYKSTNSGGNWTLVNSGMESERVQAVALEDGKIFAGTQSGGIFMSTDDGGSWTAVNSGFSSPPPEVLSLTADGAGMVYAGTSTGIFKSDISSVNWTEKNTGLGVPTYAIAVAVDPDNSNHVFAGLHFMKGVYESDNGGDSWTQVLAGKIGYSLFLDSTNLYAGTNDGVYSRGKNDAGNLIIHRALGKEVYAVAVNADGVYSGTGEGVYLDIDPDWAATSKITSIIIEGTALYAGTEGIGVFIKTELSEWTRQSNGLPSLRIYDMAKSGSAIYAGTEGGIFRSIDNGENWTELCGSCLQYNAVYSLVVYPDGTIIYAGLNKGGVKSIDGGCNWEEKFIPDGDFKVSALALSGDDLYAGFSNGQIYKSEDGGYNWIEVTDPPVGSECIRELAVKIGNPNTLFAADKKGIFKITGGGSTIENKRLNDEVNSSYTSLALDASNSSHVYAGAAGVPLRGIYESLDSGDTWNPVDDSMHVEALLFDSTSTTLYVGTATDGVYKSGSSFDPFNDGLPSVIRINALSFDPTNPFTIHAGTSIGPYVYTIDNTNPDPEPEPRPRPGPVYQCITDADCNDKNPCTNESCFGGFCRYTTDDTATCNDGLFCTVDDTCVDGECVGTARDCDDGNFCTGTESCDEAGEECVSSGDPCEEGEECSEVKDACLLPPVPGELSLTPDSADLVSEQSVNFTAECTGDCEEPDYEWSVDSNIGSIIDQDGNYVAGINTDCSEVATDVIVVEDNANGLFAEAEMTVSCDRIIGVTNISNPLWLLNPTAISSSHFLPLFKMLFIHAENGGFDKTSVLSFEPAENINVLGKIAKGNNLLGFVIVKPNAEECLYRATIETGSHMVTKKEALNMSLLPWILEE